MTRDTRLMAILEAMNADLRRGEFLRIEGYCVELETFLVEPRYAQAGGRGDIRRLAQRNMECLKAAQAGLRAGMRRLAELAAAERADIYDRTGRRQPMAGGTEGRRL